MSENQYFAAQESDKTAEMVLDKANTWYNEIYNNGYLAKVREVWMAYHGAYYTSVSGGHKIIFGGEQGELTHLAVNHLRNIAQHILQMITSNRPSFQARATNKDYKSLAQVKLANQLLDYYLREKRMEKYLHLAVEYAIVLGSGYLKMDWNATGGEVYDIQDETGLPIYEGDVQFSNLSPYDVVFDTTREGQNHDWVICRSFRNKFDFVAKYPEFESKIVGLKTKSDLYKFRLDLGAPENTDDVPVYEFYHRKTESMPDGRYMLFLTKDIVLSDSPLPYRNIPVYRISPSDILGTPYGYTPMFDLLPIQDAVNSLYSTVLTNQHAFGVQNIYVPRGADISFKSIIGGLNLVEGNAGAGKPEALNLTDTPKEIFEFIKMLEGQMEVISGVNSVARGNPEASLKSGAALALVQSMALQFISGLQQQYVEMVEDVGTGLVNMLKDFASVPRIAMVVGKSNRSYVSTEFTGDDLSQVNRVIVDMGNPISKCLAKGTEVLMYDGSMKKVEDIAVGDRVMGPDSDYRTVNNVNTGTEMMYKITSKDKNLNIKYGCNESHILSLRYCSDDRRYGAKKGDLLDISVRDYNNLPNRQKRLLMGFTTGVEFDSKKEYEIPPYILGAWLGDGHSKCTAITTMDPELLKEWTDYAHSIGMQIRISTNDNCGQAKIYFITSGEANGKSNRNIMMNSLKSMELFDNKHIPKYYLNSPREDRLHLLAGLLDTDGTLTKTNTFVFTQKSDKLSDGVVHLAKSLGFRVSHLKRLANLNGVDNVYNQITIGGDTWDIPTKLPRKRAVKSEKYRNWLNYGINVTPVGEGQYYGFTLKEEPHFVLGNFTVTHNTTAGKMEMASQLIQYGIVKTPEEYVNVMTTGQLDTLTDDTQKELMLIESENEQLSEGKPVRALAIDEHLKHIKGHRAVLADPSMRDGVLADTVLRHINEHIDLLRNTDPALLSIIGEQSLGPIGGSPPANQAPNQEVNGGQQPTAATEGAPPAVQGSMPSMPEMPQVPAEALSNPQFQQQSMGNVKQ